MFHDLDILHNAEGILLIASVILFFSIFAGKAGYRFGLPALLLFLGVGMLFGSDGLGIQFSNPNAAQFIGMLALSIILFSGGMDTKISEVKPIAPQGVILATIGVLATTFITGGFIYYLSKLVTGYETLTLPESLLMAAVMSSTDSASVFSILRSKGVYLKERLRPTLELESGSNDPMAYMLTLLLIAYIQTAGMNLADAALSLVIQLSVGAIAGFLLGKIAVFIINKIDIDNESLYPILLLATAFFTFAATTLCKGNGYLAVYIAGLVVGNAKIVHKKSIGTFFDGFAWLWQIVMFLTLGLLVNPHELLPVAPIGLTIGIFFRQFDTEYIFSFRFVDHIQPFGSLCYGSALYQQRKDGDKEYHIEYQSGVFYSRNHRVSGEDDRYGAAQTYPRYIQLSFKGEVFIRNQAKEHADRTGEDNHRDGRYFIPKGNTVLMENDKLLMISDNDEALLQAYEALGITDYTLTKN